MQSEIQEVVRQAPPWVWFATVAMILGVALLTWLAAHWVGRRLRGKTKLGLQRLERLAAPLSMLAAAAASLVIVLSPPGEAPPLLEAAVDVLGVIGGFWLTARILDVVWATGRESARLRAQPTAADALLVGRYLGKLGLFAAAATTVAVVLGATEQLYVVLAALTAALAFAARDPIRELVVFAAMVLDPPYRLGDHVRISDYRGGEEVTGEVVGISLTGTTIRTKEHTHVVVSNLSVNRLRIENLSVADRRRLELAVPIAAELSTATLRDACGAIEADLRASPHVSAERAPRVWISGFHEGMQLKASFWLRRDADRREAQRELLLSILSRLEEHGGRATREPSLPAPSATPA